MTTDIVQGSLSMVAKQTGKSIAEAFIGVDSIIIVDTSGSMDSCDSRGNQSRYTIACEELANLQKNLSGRIAVFAFSDDVIFCPSGIPHYFGGGTDLAKALRFIRIADIPGTSFYLISDGQPDAPDDALAVARTYQNKINVIFVGDERVPTGRDFLQRLAKATGGKTVTVDRAKELKTGIETLLLHG